MALRAPAAVALLAVLTVLAAGCGGESDSPQEEWAESICSPLVEWRDEMQTAGDELRDAIESGTTGIADTLRETGEQAADATEEMLSQLEGVGAPPVDEDSDAAEVVDGLAESLRETRETVTEQLEGLEGSGSVAAVTEALALVAAQLSGAVTQVQTTLETLGSVGGELEDAFADAESCQELNDDSG